MIVPADPTVAVAAAPGPTGVGMVTVGVLVYPDPLSVIVYFLIPFSDVSILQVALAPTPPPPDIVIVGVSVYPTPAFVNKISLIEYTLFLTVVIATAVAFASTFPSGDAVNDTVGVLV